MKAAFDNAGIVMPEPMYKLRVIEMEALAPGSPKKQMKAYVKEIQDVRAGDEVERRGIEEQGRKDAENLLDKDAPKEL